MSWLGFGKKEKQPSTEESNNEVQPATEHEQDTVVKPAADSINNDASEALPEAKLLAKMEAVEQDVEVVEQDVEDRKSVV